MAMSKHNEREHATKRAFWQQHMETWQASQLKATEYCREQSLSIQQFKYWQYRLVPQTKKTELNTASSEFIEVNLSTMPDMSPAENHSESRDNLIIESPHGYRVNIPLSSPQSTLVKVLTALRHTSC